MGTREPLFGEDKIGRVLSELFYDCETLDLSVQGRVGAAGRLWLECQGMDSVHQMLHRDVDYFEREPKLEKGAKELRRLLIRRTVPPEAWNDEMNEGQGNEGASR